jgi:hypothetical protein
MINLSRVNFIILLALILPSILESESERRWILDDLSASDIRHQSPLPSRESVSSNLATRRETSRSETVPSCQFSEIVMPPVSVATEQNWIADPFTWADCDINIRSSFQAAERASSLTFGNACSKTPTLTME